MSQVRKDIVAFIDQVLSDNTSTYVDKLSKITTKLKKDNDLFGIHISADSSPDVTSEQVAKDAIMVLRSYYVGECEDVTQEVLNGKY